MPNDPKQNKDQDMNDPARKGEDTGKQQGGKQGQGQQRQDQGQQRQDQGGKQMPGDDTGSQRSGTGTSGGSSSKPRDLNQPGRDDKE